VPVRSSPPDWKRCGGDFHAVEDVKIYAFNLYKSILHMHIKIVHFDGRFAPRKPRMVIKNQKKK
jgi:hypothetical protein